MLALASALQAAHGHGIVHRDLKGENLFLAVDATGQKTLKVLDFGLARTEERDEGSTSTLTSTGAFGGTPEYMSPEQCRSLRVGPSTDLYAMGCLLTEMLQLATPFAGGSASEIVARQLFMKPPPLARRGAVKADRPWTLRRTAASAGAAR